MDPTSIGGTFSIWVGECGVLSVGSGEMVKTLIIDGWLNCIYIYMTLYIFIYNLIYNFYVTDCRPWLAEMMTNDGARMAPTGCLTPR